MTENEENKKELRRLRHLQEKTELSLITCQDEAEQAAVLAKRKELIRDQNLIAEWTDES